MSVQYSVHTPQASSSAHAYKCVFAALSSIASLMMVLLLFCHSTSNHSTNTGVVFRLILQTHIAYRTNFWLSTLCVRVCSCALGAPYVPLLLFQRSMQTELRAIALGPLYILHMHTTHTNTRTHEQRGFPLVEFPAE